MDMNRRGIMGALFGAPVAAKAILAEDVPVMEHVNSVQPYFDNVKKASSNVNKTYYSFRNFYDKNKDIIHEFLHDENFKKKMITDVLYKDINLQFNFKQYKSWSQQFKHLQKTKMMSKRDIDRFLINNSLYRTLNITGFNNEWSYEPYYIACFNIILSNEELYNKLIDKVFYFHYNSSYAKWWSNHKSWSENFKYIVRKNQIIENFEKILDNDRYKSSDDVIKEFCDQIVIEYIEKD